MACPNASSAGRVLQRNAMRRIRSRWACTPNGQSIGGIAAAPPIIFMQSRRRIAVPARRPRCSAFNFHHQNRKLPAVKRGSVQNVHCRNPERRMSQMGLVSRALPVHTAMRNCTRDEGGPFEFGNQVLISSHRKLLSSKAMVVNVAKRRDMIPAGMVERGERKRTAAEVSKGD